MYLMFPILLYYSSFSHILYITYIIGHPVYAKKQKISHVEKIRYKSAKK